MTRKKVNRFASSRSFSPRLWLFRLIFFVGLLILAFPFVSQWLYYQASHAQINTFERAAATIDRSNIEHRLALARAYNAALSGTNTDANQSAITDPYSEEQKKAGQAEYARMLEVKEQIGHVMIPRMNQDIPIYAGSGEENLQRGVGHLEGTSLPVGGESTHAVLTAHRGLPTARLFTDLDKVKKGDRFYIEHIGGKMAYRVDQIKIITPDELKELYMVSGQDYVTLLTCTPYMINSHRLLVRGHRVPYEKKVEQKDIQIYQRRQYLIYIISAILVCIVMLVLLWCKRRRCRGNKRCEKT
ncbi:sortase C family protein SrtC.4 [Streptococcus equi subsp. zooepidemicus SzS31A1]|uniref:Sortase C family protein SrtC.4 n=2 Tax=Streptococcus equi subsp. zooepidemicus TaxID=40041 RepID=A0ABN0MU87_STRSZ|nr:class C sortase [Streptococcus equi]KIS16150.1 sortase C family protein SrtC.4 [Streptococcus equi subsp. zooepidemicus Sz4is]HEL0120395.1 class C sortase [Streptococcus equi subsp. zooepidemicus]EQB22971.1 sortase C family protein SrtC.4 [Streptococcus equi subsp. zooepidemicus SzS31A1]KIS04568.1 sortase C family protein SrtC.4 [Streptococcus equi subsp. zooepidemicus Sz12is]HEL0124462.1 class C sortase [Streptococcus equi subsp. zooepidemicus]